MKRLLSVVTLTLLCSFLCTGCTGRTLAKASRPNSRCLDIDCRLVEDAQGTIAIEVNLFNKDDRMLLIEMPRVGEPSYQFSFVPDGKSEWPESLGDFGPPIDHTGATFRFLMPVKKEGSFTSEEVLTFRVTLIAANCDRLRTLKNGTLHFSATILSLDAEEVPDVGSEGVLPLYLETTEVTHQWKIGRDGVRIDKESNLGIPGHHTDVSERETGSKGRRGQLSTLDRLNDARDEAR